MAQQQTVVTAGISPTLALEIQIGNPVMTVWHENGSKVRRLFAALGDENAA